ERVVLAPPTLDAEQSYPRVATLEIFDDGVCAIGRTDRHDNDPGVGWSDGEGILQPGSDDRFFVVCLDEQPRPSEVAPGLGRPPQQPSAQPTHEERVTRVSVDEDEQRQPEQNGRHPAASRTAVRSAPLRAASAMAAHRSANPSMK